MGLCRSTTDGVLWPIPSMVLVMLDRVALDRVVFLSSTLELGSTLLSFSTRCSWLGLGIGRCHFHPGCRIGNTLTGIAKHRVYHRIGGFSQPAGGIGFAAPPLHCCLRLQSTQQGEQTATTNTLIVNRGSEGGKCSTNTALCPNRSYTALFLRNLNLTVIDLLHHGSGVLTVHSATDRAFA